MLYDEGNFGRKGTSSRKNHNTNRTRQKSNLWLASDREFRCANCRQMVYPTPTMGTAHRNHCPYCLYSLHVDTRPGNRAAACHARMEPVGLTFKHNGFDKYGNARGGDIMLVHVCSGCGAVNINRIASDDSCHAILELFERSMCLDGDRAEVIAAAGIELLQRAHFEQLHTALFGKRRSEL